MAVNVVLTRKFFDADLQFIKNGVKEGANIIIPEAYTEDDLMKYAPEADIFFGPVISKKLCEAAKHLKFIQVPWTGVDNLNFDLIREIGVKVCNSHSNAYAVAEQALALMFDAAKKIAYHDRLMRTGDWNRPKPDKSNTVSPFSGRVSKSQVGIIGYGHIGRIIKQYLSAMECQFHVADISVNEQKVEELFSDQFVGDMGLLNGEPRSATAVALENETVLELLKEEEFETFFKENPSRVFQLMGQLSHRLRRTTRNYLDACKTAYNLVEKEKAAQADA